MNSELYKLIHEMEDFWNDIDRLNTYEHKFTELAFEVDVKASGIDVVSDAYKAFQRIGGLLEDSRNSDERLPSDFSRLLKRKGIDPVVFRIFHIMKIRLKTKTGKVTI